ncbi:MAG: hypothetical protein U1E42_11425 [Rhodospirillales bacterium]
MPLQPDAKFTRIAIDLCRRPTAFGQVRIKVDRIARQVGDDHAVVAIAVHKAEDFDEGPRRRQRSDIDVNAIGIGPDLRSRHSR